MKTGIGIVVPAAEKNCFLQITLKQKDVSCPQGRARDDAKVSNVAPPGTGLLRCCTTGQGLFSPRQSNVRSVFTAVKQSQARGGGQRNGDYEY